MNSAPKNSSTLGKGRPLHKREQEDCENWFYHPCATNNYSNITDWNHVWSSNVVSEKLETTSINSNDEIKHCRDINSRFVKHLHVVGIYPYFLLVCYFGIINLVYFRDQTGKWQHEYEITGKRGDTTREKEKRKSKQCCEHWIYHEKHYAIKSNSG